MSSGDGRKLGGLVLVSRHVASISRRRGGCTRVVLRRIRGCVVINFRIVEAGLLSPVGRRGES